MTRPHFPTVQHDDDDFDGPQVGDVIGDKYRIERLIGRGGMGLVYQAAHVITGKRFAIKWLLPDHSSERHAVDRFIREAQVAGHVEHPNIVEVYDVGKAGDSFYMVMELLAGESLEARFLRSGAMPVREVVRIMLPCARGVARAHAAGIIHRDLKPANIFLRRSSETGAETPKVLDFGISKMADAIAPNSAITKTGMLIGTPYYMSPEQVHAKDVDARTDVYAFGVILYQLVGGKLPFDAATYSSLLVKILTEVPAPLESIARGVPDAFGRLVKRAMAREPEARFQSMPALIAALERFEMEPAREGRSFMRGAGGFDATSQRAPARMSRETPRAPRKGLFAGLIGALLLIVLGCALYLWWIAPRSTPAPEAPRPERAQEAPSKAPAARAEDDSTGTPARAEKVPSESRERAEEAPPTRPHAAHDVVPDAPPLPSGLNVPSDAPVPNPRAPLATPAVEPKAPAATAAPNPAAPVAPSVGKQAEPAPPPAADPARAKDPPQHASGEPTSPKPSVAKQAAEGPPATGDAAGDGKPKTPPAPSAREPSPPAPPTPHSAHEPEAPASPPPAPPPEPPPEPEQPAKTKRPGRLDVELSKDQF